MSRSSPPYRRPRMYLLLILSLAVTSLGLYGGYRVWTRASSSFIPLTRTVQPQDFHLQIDAVGELQSEESVAIAVPNVPANRLRIASLVPDGFRVQKGDVLMEFDPTELSFDILEHRSNLEIANQKIQKGELATGVERTDIIKDRRIAELELAKIKEFLPKDSTIFARSQIIEGELDKDYTAKKIVFADARLELKGRVYTLDEAILLLERKQADSKISQFEKALTSLKLLSPSEGMIVHNDPGSFYGSSRLMPGKTVWIGMTLFNLVNPEKMQAKCFVLEKDAGELQIGQTVGITLDSFPRLPFAGKVKSIDKVARPIDRDSPVKYFQTIVSLDKTDSRMMKPGLKLKARIEAGELKSVIVIPRSAIVKKDADTLAYILKDPEHFESVPVTLGKGDQVQVVVSGGLRSGQILALNPPDVKADFTGAPKK